MPKLVLATFVVLSLAAVSLFVGVSDISPASLLSDPVALEVFLVSRVPRTLALIMAGAGMATAGLIMQMLARNRFVEPSTAGTVESASLGILAITLLAPATPLIGKMAVATLSALAGTVLFFAILSRIPLRSVMIVPLVGLMLGGVINAVTMFFAYRFDLLQSLGAWTMGDFSGVLRGRYELIYLSVVLTVAAFVAADRFTVAGLVLACDIFGRLIRAPYEVPVGTVVGVIGAGVFLTLLLRRRHEFG